MDNCSNYNRLMDEEYAMVSHKSNNALHGECNEGSPVINKK